MKSALLVLMALAAGKTYQPCDLSDLACRNSILAESADAEQSPTWPYISTNVPQYSWIRIVCERTDRIQALSGPGLFGSYNQAELSNYDVAQACQKVEALLAERDRESLTSRNCYGRGDRVWCRSTSNYQCFSAAAGWYCHDECKDAITYLLNGLPAWQQDKEVEYLRTAADEITISRKSKEHVS